MLPYLGKPSVHALRRWLRYEGKIRLKVLSTRAIQAHLTRRVHQIVSARRRAPKPAADNCELTRGVLEAIYALELIQSDHTLVEPRRVCRRPQLLRGRGYDEQDDEQVLT